MNKLKKKGAKSNLASINKNNAEASVVKKERITTVGKRTDTTYKVPPLSIRLSQADKKELSDWVDELNEKTEKNRKANPAKLLRALLEIKDKIPEDELIKAINAQ